jgi:hypothetical protein
VLSSEPWRGHDAADDTGAARYDVLLKHLLDRTAAALTRLDSRPSQHALTLNVSERSGPAPFEREDLARMLADFGARWPGITLADFSVRKYKGDLAAGYVLADFAANRTRLILDQPAKPLADIEAEVVRELEAPVRSGQPDKRSHLAATVDDLPKKCRRWVKGQAAEWAGGGV